MASAAVATLAEKKAVLTAYRSLNRRIDRLVVEKRQWEERALSISPHYSPVPKGGGHGDGMQTAISRILDIEREIDEEVDRLAALRDRIEGAVRRVAGEPLRELLRYRYIDGLTWEQVAEKMHYSYAHIFRMHEQALRQIML